MRGHIRENQEFNAECAEEARRTASLSGAVRVTPADIFAPALIILPDKNLSTDDADEHRL